MRQVATVSAGTRLGPYEVLERIGAGGMGEVYRARDPRLARDVAVKVLPADCLTDFDRLERFQREARAAAALNHPNVVAIYDTGTSDGVPFIASELLTGTTLRETLTPGVGWPVRKALDVAQQIARGLAAAHGRGIVHRDLKPENIFLGSDGGVKILDFGLARLKEGPVLPATEEATMPGTEAGRVLGTVGYMAPEQVRGQSTDHRADLFAFGAILYEMLTGRRAFTGETAADTMTAILTREPPEISEPARPIPPALERIVARCLEKQPEARFQSASDLAFALASIGTSAGDLEARHPVARLTTRRRWWLATAGFAATAALGAMVGALFGSASSEATRATFLDIAPPSGPDILRGSSPALSNNGRHVAFSVNESGVTRLWIGSLDVQGFRRVAGTEGAMAPFWSPDDRHVGFFTYSQPGGTVRFKAVHLATEAVETRAEIADSGNLGDFAGTWNSRGDIILTLQAVFHLRSSGGSPLALMMPDLARGEIFLSRPQFLPDGRHFLFTAFGRGADAKSVYVGALGSDGRTSILQADSGAWYAAPGYLLFARQGTLFAQPFDADRRTLSGRPERIAGGLQTGSFGPDIGVSQARTLFFTTGDPVRSRFTWIDRTGREFGRIGEPIEAFTFDVTMDGTTAVTMRGLPGELWQIDTKRGGMSRLTDGIDDADPRLSADGKSVLFAGTYEGRRGLDRVRLSGRARTRLYESVHAHQTPQDVLTRLLLHDWSRDGRLALCDITGLHREIWAVTLSDGRAQIAIRAAGLADQARFSPDRRWIAYNDLESGRPEVFVVPFPPTGERWQISTAGGVQPEWRGDGRELFYLDRSGTLMAVDVSAAASLETGTPRPLFSTRLTANPQLDEYRVTADGQRFLLRVPVAGTTRTTIVLNWPALLKQ